MTGETAAGFDLGEDFLEKSATILGEPEGGGAGGERGGAAVLRRVPRISETPREAMVSQPWPEKNSSRNGGCAVAVGESREGLNGWAGGCGGAM